MSYAIIKLSGKQYKVAEGEELKVQKLDEEEGKKLTVKDVLLVHNGKKATVGTPTVSKASVDLEVVSHQREQKLRVSTYKSKSRYRKTKGHRTATTTLKVSAINA